MTAATLTMALPFTAQADDNRAADFAAVGQGIKSNLKHLQQCASTVQQCQTQLSQLQQQLADAAQPGLALYAKAQQTLQSLQEAQRMFENSSLYLRRVGDLAYYRARASNVQDASSVGDAGQVQTQRTAHAQRHH